MTANETVSEAVDRERQRQGLSRSGLARLLGWGPGQVTRKLDGQLRWSMDDLDLVSERLGVPLPLLLAPARELVSTTHR